MLGKNDGSIAVATDVVVKTASRLISKNLDSIFILLIFLVLYILLLY
jgi:hypothetical protein